MGQDKAHPPPPVRPSDRAGDHLSNERTYLTWIRTSLALIGMGFVLTRMGLLLEKLEARGSPALGPTYRWDGDPFVIFGVVVLALGVALSGWSGWLYHRTRKAFDSGTYEPSWRSVLALTVLVVAIGLGIFGILLWGMLVPTKPTS